MNYDFQAFRGDLIGGITSAIVALPVALAFGVASGLGAAAGIYGAIAVGFFASVFGGTRSQISGPTPSMTVAMAVIVTTHASTLGEALTVVVMGGLLQVLLGISRLGRFVAYTPYVVISGFMSGIGIIIILIQLLPFLGAPTSPHGPMGALGALPDALTDTNTSAVIIASVSLAIGVFWPRRLSRYLPSPLASLVAGTLLGVLWLTDAPVIGQIPMGLPEMQFTMPSVDFLISAVHPAIILALLGSVDSLLTSLIADSLTGTQHRPNRELVGQGIGNMVAGLFGGLPGAGATMGTVTNIRAGGRTPVSGALRSVLLVMLLLGLGQYVEPIPHAVLAGILVKIGWDIIDWRFLTLVHRIRREHLLVMLLTLGLTVFVDLVTAVAIGLIAAGMTHAQQLETLELDSVISVPLLDRTFFSEYKDMVLADPYSARVGLVALRGSFTVASSRKLVEVIGGDIKDHEIVIFDFSETAYLDDSAAMVVERLLNAAMETQTEVLVAGLSDTIEDTLRTLNILRLIPAGYVVDTLDEARQAAYNLLWKHDTGGELGPDYIDTDRR